MDILRWMYRDGHPNSLAKFMNQGSALIFGFGISPNYMVTLEVVGRHSGKVISFPLVMTVIDGSRYLVSMLGENANWVRNLAATGWPQIWTAPGSLLPEHSAASHCNRQTA
jgi:hypothetical protein